MDSITSRDRDLFESAFTQWEDITYSTLFKVYKSSKYASEFKEKHSSKVEYVSSTWVPDVEYYLSKQLTQKLDYLKMLQDTIDDFREEVDQPTAAEKKGKLEQIPSSESSVEGKKDSIWQDIKNEYGMDKRAVGKKISFVTDTFKKVIIFRDIEQAYILASTGFPKPAVILAGGVIEELLRLYLQTKALKPTRNDFDGYIKACQDNGLLKLAIHRLTDSVRYFRNIVHLEKETSLRHTISKATAKGAVASIFTVMNDFEF